MGGIQSEVIGKTACNVRADPFILVGNDPWVDEGLAVELQGGGIDPTLFEVPQFEMETLLIGGEWWHTLQDHDMKSTHL
jgi:hypothetical protein